MLGGKSVWLGKADRVGLINSVNIEKQAGKEETTLWFDGIKYTLPVQEALLRLNELELYALKCYNVTQQHIATVKALRTVEEVNEYDHTAGYPERLVFYI